MTTYSSNSDFATDSVGTIADEVSTTAITDWTWIHSQANWYAEIVAQGDDSKAVELNNGGTANRNVLLAMDGPGSIAASTETDCLVRFYFDSLAANNHVLRMRAGGAIADGYYTLVVFSSGNARMQYWTNLAASAHIGSEVAKGVAAATWYWARINVTSGGAWSWRIWSGAVGDEPGSWDGTGTNTTRTGGYVGIGGLDYNGLPDRFDWFSCGTAGDSAPSPGGGSSIIPQGSHGISRGINPHRVARLGGVLET